jgi:hypothetical protein
MPQVYESMHHEDAMRLPSPDSAGFLKRITELRADGKAFLPALYQARHEFNVRPYLDGYNRVWWRQ